MWRQSVLSVVVPLLVYLVTARPSCTTFTPSQDHPGHPLLHSTHQHGQQVEVDVELIPPPHPDQFRLHLLFYHSDVWLGQVELWTDPDLGLTIGGPPPPDRHRVDQVVFRRPGVLTVVHANWSIPTTLLKGSRHLRLMMLPSSVAVLEVMGGSTRLVTEHSWPTPFSSFPDITVRVMCWRGDCGQVRQCRQAPPPNTEAQPVINIRLGNALANIPLPSSTVPPTTDTLTTDSPTTKSYTAVWVLLIIVTVVVVASGGVVATKRYHQRYKLIGNECK